jgi:hypothetical protein
MAEIFHTHERLNHDTRPPRMLRTLGASLVAHALFLAAVVYVPAVRDTFNLASTLSGLRFVEEDYTKTAVGQRADVMLNLADNKLYYPAGYFSQTDVPSPDAPQLIEQVRPEPLPVAKPFKPARVKTTPTPEASPSPDGAAGDAETAKNEGDKTGDPKASPTAAPQTQEEAERIAKEAGAEKFPTVNTKPFTDLLKQGKEMRDAKEIDLSGTLEMEVEANRQEDGRLTDVVVTDVAATSNPKLLQLAKDFVSAISDSKLLAALKGTKHLKMRVKLDGKEVAVRVLTEMTSVSEAEKMASGYNGLLFLGALSKKGKDEEALFKSVQIASEANQIVLTFNMPRAVAGDLLSKLIKKNETVPPPPG